VTTRAALVRGSISTATVSQNRARFRLGEIRVVDCSGNVERTIAFNEADRKL